MAIIQDELVKTRLKEEQPVSAMARQGQQSANIIWQSPQQSAGTETSLTETKTTTRSGGMAGLSESTLAGLKQYGQPYTPSAAVNQAQEYLHGVMNSGPGEFHSKYSGQIASLYNQIMNRPRFNYNVNRDPLFKQYKDQYMVNGQRAMQDAVGNAAALTGGYGNSWGATAGFQAYQYYLQMLNNVIPELEQRAYSRYQDEGNELRKNLDMSTNLDNIDYGRYRDTVSDWQGSVAAAASAYNAAASADAKMWQTMQNYYKDLAEMEYNNYWKYQDDVYRRDQLAENQRQYDANLAYKQYTTGLDEAYRRDHLAENQRQYDANLAYKQYTADQDEAYRRDQLAENQRQYDANLANKQYTTDLDEAYRRDQLAQKQSQWEAEQALDREKFDFQVRKYEDALRQALAENGGGSGGGSYASSGNGASNDTASETLVAPVIVQRDNSGPLAVTAPAVTQKTWNELQQAMAELHQNSIQNKNQTTAAQKSTAALTGIPNGTLAVAALNAAKNSVAKNTEADKLKAFSQ